MAGTSCFPVCKLLLSITLLVELLAQANGDVSARVFLYKTVKGHQMVQDQNSSIEYTVINNGELTASDIVVQDKLDLKAFITDPAAVDLDGFLNFILSELAPGAKESMSISVVPKLSPGVYQIPRALVSYSFTGEDSQIDERSGVSTSVRVKVISRKQHLKDTGLLLMEWGVLAAGYVLTCFVPLVVWLRARISNDKYSKKKSA